MKRKQKTCVWLLRDGFVSGKEGYMAPCDEIWWSKEATVMFDYCPHCGRLLKIKKEVTNGK